MSEERVYGKSAADVLAELETDGEEGLTAEAAAKKKKEHGENRIETGEGVSPWKIFVHNANNLIVYLLLAAAGVSLFMQDYAEAIAVLIAIGIAVFFGFFTELRAQKSMEALQDMIETPVRVIRDGELSTLDSHELVPGDLLLIESGEAITADARLVETGNFSVMEAALTGESEAVEKDADFRSGEKLPLGDQVNRVFAGTAATRGSARAVVTHTGMDTEMGKISEMMQKGESGDSPLDRELEKLGKYLILFAAGAGVVVTLLGILRGDPLSDVVHLALILAVAAIPEAMPAVSTMTLARGMRTMARQEAMVKTLGSVETLGSTSVICSDKTGTLTENEMTVAAIFTRDGETYEVTGTGYRPEGAVCLDGEEVEPEGILRDFIVAGSVNNTASLSEEDGHWQIEGDPTDGALLTLAHKTGLDPDEKRDAVTDQLPFDSENKYMITAVREEEGHTAWIKGAVDVLVEQESDEEILNAFRSANETFAKKGMRVLAVGRVEEYDPDTELTELDALPDTVTMLGLAGILDPPREDVKASVRSTQEAGIRVKMITGDHPETASVIAEEIGITGADRTLSGQELDALFADPPEDVCEQIMDTAVFARVSPENKLQIIDALQDRGAIVAMTGDGVNDGPALHGADIGVAMGIRGTEVAKEAADIILTDDRFSTIVEAVKQGRIIFANIRKFVTFLFTCYLVEIVTTILAILFLLPVPIQPLHILWLNLVIDLSPALAFSMEPAEGDVMELKPRKKTEGLVTRGRILQILTNGVVMAAGCFLFFRHLRQTEPIWWRRSRRSSF